MLSRRRVQVGWNDLQLIEEGPRAKLGGERGAVGAGWDSCVCDGAGWDW